MPIRHVIFDFDGSCTLVQCISAQYLAEYGRRFAELDPRIAGEWETALDVVRDRSPEAGWMLGGKPSAPAAADPYILAYEAARYLTWKLDLEGVPNLHTAVYDRAPAGFRPDLIAVLEGVVARGMQVSFISNSSTAKIERRLDELLASRPALRQAIEVIGDAAKFVVREIEADIPDLVRQRFERLPVSVAVPDLERRVYLRRGAYLEALCRVWGNDPAAVAETIVCGDIWDLDLALPAALGTRVHLITRAAPYKTYAYELRAAQALGAAGGVSDELSGLLPRLSS